MIDYSATTNSIHAVQVEHLAKDPAARRLTLQGSTEIINIDDRHITAETASKNYLGTQTHSRQSSNEENNPENLNAKLRTFNEDQAMEDV
jgi:hypothetical protein